MPRKAFSKPDSGPSSIATIGFEADSGAFGIRHSDFVICSVWVQHFIHHLAPQTALRDSAFIQREASPEVVSKAKDNMAGVDFVCLRSASAVLANGRMSSNQSGDCPARSAMKKPKAKPQSLPRQRDIRRALIEADLVDCMVALPGQLFYSTQPLEALAA